MSNNQDPKVLIFSNAYLPLTGGAELAIKEITDRIDNFEFDLITARLDNTIPEFEKIGKVNVYRVGWGTSLDKYLFPVLAYLKAKKLHQKRPYQIVQALMAFYGGLAALFFKLKYPQVKYLLTMQSGDADFFIWLRTWFWYPIYRQIYTKPNYIQAISSFLAKRARKYGYKGQIEIVPNGVNLEKFKLQKPDTDLRKSLDINSDKKIVITVSRLVEKNGLDDLIKAVQNLSVKLLILGLGSDEQKLKNLVKELKIEHKVLFVGHIDHRDLPKYLSQADVFVRPSLSEGLGTAFLEAMAAGLPVVATPIGGIVDFLEDKKTGLYCQVRNPQSISDKINEVLSDWQLRENLVKNGQALIREKYDWLIISQQMEKIYQKLL